VILACITSTSLVYLAVNDIRFWLFDNINTIFCSGRINLAFSTIDVVLRPTQMQAKVVLFDHRKKKQRGTHDFPP